MLQIRKLTIGIQPAEKAFRVQSRWGEVLDAITAARGKKPFDEIGFDAIAVASSRDQFALKSENRGTTFSLSAENIYYQRSAYGKEGGVNTEKFVEEFLAVWGIAQKRLSLSGIRRIGIVAEHRCSDIDVPSEFLTAKLLKFPASQDVEKFSLSFEKRYGANGGNYKRGESFYNVIQQIYDSKLDSEVPEPNALNANLDVQCYYVPPLERMEDDKVNIVRRQFESYWRAYQAELRKLGLVE